MLSTKSLKSVAIRKPKLTKRQKAGEGWQYEYDKAVQHRLQRQRQPEHNHSLPRMVEDLGEQPSMLSEVDEKTATTSKVSVDEESIEVEVDPVRLQYGAACSQGKRQYMEDRRAIILSVPGSGLLKKWAFFGVFDGHRGQTVATLCSEKLLETIIKTVPFIKHDQGCKALDAVEDFRAGIREGFLELDEQMKFMTSDNSGSTAAVILISPTHVYLANCGDSRSLFCWDDFIRFTTEDHKPAIAEEASRILKAGGSVKLGERDSQTLRVNGHISLSRAFGDYDFKQNYEKSPTRQMIIAEPDIAVHKLPSNGKGIIIIVSDGITEKLTSAQLVAHAAHNLKLTRDHNEICDRIVEASYYQNGKDNMTVILVTIGYTAKCISKIELRKNWNIEGYIKKRMMEILQSDEDATMYTILKELEQQVNELMPPGLGIYSKINFMSKVFRRHELSREKKSSK